MCVVQCSSLKMPLLKNAALESAFISSVASALPLPTVIKVNIKTLLNSKKKKKNWRRKIAKKKAGKETEREKIKAILSAFRVYLFCYN